MPERSLRDRLLTPELIQTIIAGGPASLGRQLGDSTVLLEADDQPPRRVVKWWARTSMSNAAASRLLVDLSQRKTLQASGTPRVIDFESFPEGICAVVEYIAGAGLDEMLDAGRFPVREALRTAVSMFSSLAELHRSGVLHRDIKSRNLLFPSDRSRPILVDIGASRAFSFDSDQSVLHSTSALYLSPEQAGSIDYDVGEPADLYSAGILLFQCLTGSVPFHASCISKTLLQHLTSPVPELRSLGVDAPGSLEELIQRLLKKDPRDRYQCADAVCEDLQIILGSLEDPWATQEITLGRSDRRQTLIDPAIIARREELAAFDELLRNTAEGHGTLACLEAEPGGGKTRMLGELIHRAHNEHLQVLLGQGATDVAQRPLTILSGVADAFIRIAEAQPDWAERVQSRMRHHWQTLLSLLPQLAERYGTLTKSSAVPDDFAEARSVDALVAWFDSMGEADFPVIIAVDDCQWADDISLRSICQWYQNGAAHPERCVSIVVAFRGDEVPADHLLRGIDGHVHLRLAGLGREEICRLVESMAGVVPVPAVEIVADLADGSPFMATAVLRGLVECGALVASDNGWLLDPEAMAEIQSSRHAASLLSKRIDTLSSDVQELLAVAAVIGKEFDLEMVATLAGLPMASALAAIDDARRRKLLWARPDGTHFVFIHDIIRRTFCERLSPEDWKNLNRRAASHYEQFRPTQESDIAFFYDAAGEAERALPFAIRAAEFAKNHFSFEPADTQYRIALKGLGTADEQTRLTVLEGYAEVLIMRGRYDDAESILADALEAADSTCCKSKIQRRLAELSFKRGNMDVATSGFEKALRTLGGFVPSTSLGCLTFAVWQILIQILHTAFPKIFLHRTDRLPNAMEKLKIQLYSNLAHGGWYSRSKLYCLGSHLKGMNMAERYRPSHMLAAAYAEHAPIISLLSLYDRGFSYAERSFAIRQRFDDKWGQGQALHYGGIVLYAAGRYEECISKCELAISLLLQTGDYWQVHIARYQIAAAHYHLGNQNISVAESKKNYLSGRSVGDNLASSIIMDVWVRASRGRVDKSILEEAFSNPPADVQGVAQVHIAQGVYALYQDNFDKAIEHLMHAVEMSERAGLKNVYTLPAFSWLSTAYRKKLEALSVYDGVRRRQLLKRAHNVARKAVWVNRLCRVELPRSLKEYALIVAMNGDHHKSRRLLNRALKVALDLRAGLEIEEILEAFERVKELAGWSEIAVDHRYVDELSKYTEVMNRRGAAEYELDAREGTLALLDRFDTLLDVGRRIASAITIDRVFEELQSGTERLLRGERCELFRLTDAVDSTEDLTAILEEMLGEQAAVGIRAVHMGRSISATGDELTVGTRSLLCSPIAVRGTVTALLCTSHDHVSGLFGPHEHRLADFVATIAGAALENAEGFLELKQLNDTLEQRIAERTEAAESRSQELAESNGELRRVAHELRQTEEQLRLAIRDAEAANHAKSEFLATLGHEIRTPMNGILGMTELALSSSKDEQQRKYLALVKQSGDSLLGLLNGVLDLSKIEAGRMELESIGVNLQELVGGIVQLMAVPASNKGIEIVYSDSGDIPSQVLGDPTRLRQVIVNLVGNAIKFTECGYVSVGLRCIDHDERTITVQFVVADTGIGIDPDKQQRVFESFCQSDSSTSRRFGGTGLGLTISARLVELMNGVIEVESTVGVGSQFSFAVTFERSEPQWLSGQDLANVAIDFAGDRQPSTSRGTADRPQSHGVIVGPTAPVMEILSAPLRDAGVDVEIIPWNPGAAIDDQAAPAVGEPDFVIVDCGPDTRRAGEVLRQIIRGNYFLGSKVLALVPLGDIGVDPCVIDGSRIRLLYKPLIGSCLVDAIAHLYEEPRVVSSAPGSSAVPSAKSWKILVADDGEINRDVAVGLLEMMGHKCATASNGSEAVEMLSREYYDAVLMDLEMPDVDGIEATRRIRKSELGGNRKTPIIAVTAHALSCYEEKCFESGMDGYLAKPFVAKDVIETLDRIISATLECDHEPPAIAAADLGRGQ